jgi:hypothetical protein
MRRSTAQIGVTAVLLTLTACASNQTAQHPPMPSDTPSAYVAEARPPRVDIEEDGLPAQLAPRERPAIPDDPREPWSRNYGTVRSSQVVEPPTRATAALSTSSIVAKVIPQWPSFLRTAQIDEDAIIRQAIAEHEMRQED